MKHLLLLSLLILATATLAHAQRMPVTTASDAARLHYVRGVDALANVSGHALAHFDASLAADPSFAMAHLYRAAATQDGRDEHMRQATALGARASEAERQSIEAYAANLRGDHDREIALYSTIAERYPSDPLPMLIVANTEMGRSRFAEAVAAARRALTADPAFAPAYNTMGYAEMAAGNAEAAEQAFREQIRLAPDHANPYDSYGEFLMLEGRLDEAEAQFEMALTKDPTFEVSRTNLARIGIERSDLRFEQAVAAGDADAIAALYTENAVILPPDGPPITGRAAIRDYMAGLVAAGIDGVDIETVEVLRFDDMAVERANLTLSVGGEVVEEGKSIVLWQLVGDEWLYARDMWSSNAPPAAGTH